MKLKEIIIAYYLGPFIIFNLIFGVLALGLLVIGDMESSRMIESIGVCFVAASALTLFVGSLYYYVYEIAIPRRRHKVLNHYSALMNYGFVLSEDRYTGTFKNYYFQVSYEYQAGPKNIEAIQIECYFNPVKDGALVPETVYKQLTEKYEAEGMEWTEGYVVSYMNYAIKKPTFEEVVKEIEKTIALLQEIGFKAISLKEMDELNTEEFPQGATIEIKDYRKPWYYRFGIFFLFPVYFWVIRVLSLQEETFIDWKILVGFLIIIGTSVSVAVLLGLKKYRVRKTDVVISTFLLTALYSYCGLLELNYQITDKTAVTYRLKVVDNGVKGKENKPYVEINHAGIEKEITFAWDTATARAVQESDSLILVTEKGVLGFEVMREWELK